MRNHGGFRSSYSSSEGKGSETRRPCVCGLCGVGDTLDLNLKALDIEDSVDEIFQIALPDMDTPVQLRVKKGVDEKAKLYGWNANIPGLRPCTKIHCQRGDEGRSFVQFKQHI